jgi:hypothetical protein
LAYIEKLDISDQSWAGARLNGLVAKDCVFTRLDLAGAALRQCEFLSCDLIEVYAQKTLMQGCKFDAKGASDKFNMACRIKDCSFENSVIDKDFYLGWSDCKNTVFYGTQTNGGSLNSEWLEALNRDNTLANRLKVRLHMGGTVYDAAVAVLRSPRPYFRSSQTRQ